MIQTHKVFNEMNKETDIIMRTPVGNTVSNNLFLIFIYLKAFSK